eukprot:GSChrysophyteH1.ASY1.ANO1.1116.1 assembled CDS
MSLRFVKKIQKRIPRICRQFSAFTDARLHVDSLRKLTHVVDEEDVDGYLTDWTGRYKQSDGLVILPKETSEVSAVLEYCHKHNIAVVPQGGNTGLVGGAVGSNGSLVMSLKRMNRIESIDTDNGVLTCEAGCILKNLDEQLLSSSDGAQFMMPLDLGSSAILADGSVLDMMRALPKDNMGLQLKQLLVGSEGTLGVITRIHLQLVTRPSQKASILLPFEFFDQANSKVESVGINGQINVLIEVATSNKSIPLREMLLSWASDELDAGSVVPDGTIVPNSLSQQQQLWQLRESIPVSLMQLRRLYKYDLSLCKIIEMSDVVRSLRAHLQVQGFFETGHPLDITIANFGHCGDLNLHLNVLAQSKPSNTRSRAASELDRLQEVLDTSIASLVKERAGSMSAEHGVGQLKLPLMNQARKPTELKVMHSIKRAFDPKGILNPGKLYPVESST